MKVTNHNHACTSNTGEVYQTFIGCLLNGVFEDDSDSQISGRKTWLIFNCGWAFVQCANGSHWTVPPDDVKKVATKVRDEYLKTKKSLENVERLAGFAP